MSESQPGFEYDGTFYPLIPVSEWRTEDADLSRRCTGMTPSRLFFSDDDDEILGRAALMAVAMHQAKPDVPDVQIIDVVRRSQPLKDFVPVGFSREVEVPKDSSVPVVPS